MLIVSRTPKGQTACEGGMSAGESETLIMSQTPKGQNACEWGPLAGESEGAGFLTFGRLCAQIWDMGLQLAEVTAAEDERAQRGRPQRQEPRHVPRVFSSLSVHGSLEIVQNAVSRLQHAFMCILCVLGRPTTVFRVTMVSFLKSDLYIPDMLAMSTERYKQ